MPPEPKLIALKEAVRYIGRSSERGRLRRPPHNPFFLMVGAGVSFPAVPLAGGIIEDCRKERPDSREPDGHSPMQSYSWWLEQAFHNPDDRRVYLQEKIQGKPPSLANLRLAHVLLSRKITNLVVTTNFDDHLSRALTLFGEPHVVCDHPETLPKIDLGDDGLQIVHVHGTYWFYNCKNLVGQIEAEAMRSDTTPFTMRDFLGDLLINRSPVVVGYSGWESDVFMSALTARLRRDLPYNIYWFCYRRQEVDQLPAEVRLHDNVYFICPDPDEAQASSEESAIRVAVPTAKEKHGGEPERSVLSATAVFERFLADLDVDEPPLTADPLAFLAKQLEYNQPADEASAGPYSIGKVIERIRQAAELERNDRRRAREVTELLETLRASLRRARYAEALEEAGQLLGRQLSAAYKQEILAAVSTCADNLADTAQKLRGYELLIVFGDRPEDVAAAMVNQGIALWQLNRGEEALGTFEEIVRKFGESAESAVQRQVARALFNQGVALGGLRRSEEAIRVLGEVAHRFGDSSDPTLQEGVARALVNQGFWLGELNRGEDEIGVYDEVVRRFGDSPQPGLQEQVANALVNKGITLGQLKRDEEALSVCDEVVRRFGDSTQAAHQERVANALLNKAIRLGQLNRSEDEVAVYDEIVRRCGESPQPALQEVVGKALFNKGITLGQLNRHDEAGIAFDEVVRRFAGSSQPSLQAQAAKALFNKGIGLGQDGRNEEEMGIYDEIVRRFGDSSVLAVQERVAKALVNKGNALGQRNRDEEAIGACDEVVRRFGDSAQPSLQEQVAKALVNKGVLLGRLNRGAEAEAAAYDEVVRRLGDSARPSLHELVEQALAGKRALAEKPKADGGGPAT
jgi:tetratricopeptide (TPR) repeat protein